MALGPYFETNDGEEIITQEVQTDVGVLRININDLISGIRKFDKVNGGGGTPQEKKSKAKPKSERKVVTKRR